MNSLGQVFSMYKAPTFATPQTDAQLKSIRERRMREEQNKRIGKSLGDIARAKLGVDTDFMKLNEDPELNKPMYDPEFFDYEMDELAPNDFELAVMQDEAENEPLDTMEYYTPDEIEDINTANMYQQMGEAGFGEEALKQIFPNQNNNLMAQKQFAMSKMAEIDADMAMLGAQYSNALRSGDKALANELFKQGNQKLIEFGQYAFGANQKPSSWKLFQQKPVDTDALEAQIAQDNIRVANEQLRNGEITQDQYNDIYYKNQAIALGRDKKVTDVAGEIQKQQYASADEQRKARMHTLGLSEAEDSMFQASIGNLQKFKTLDALDAYNKYLPTLDREFEEAKKGKAGAQRAIVVAYNKLIEPSSAVMEGDFRSSGMNNIASTASQLGDAGQAVLSGNYDQLGRRLSEAEIIAIYQSGKRIAQGLKESVKARVSREDALLRDKMLRAGFNYNPNAFSKYIGFGSSEKATLNPANFKSLGEFKRAGGTKEAWFKYYKGK